MNGVAFRFAMRRSIKPAILVGIGVGLFYWVVLLSSSAFLGDGSEPLPSFFTEPPRVMQAFIGGSADFVSPTGWLSTGVLHPIILSLTTIGAFMVAAGSGATELENGTLDLVLARPIGRRRYLAARAAASLATLTIVEAGGLAGTLISREVVRGVDGLPVGRVVLTFAGHWLLFAGFSLVCLLVFASASLRSRALGLAIGIVVGSFFINFIALLFDGVRWLGYLSPFHYFNAANVLEGGGFVGHWLVLGAITLGAAGIALRRFGTRDLSR